MVPSRAAFLGPGQQVVMLASSSATKLSNISRLPMHILGGKTFDSKQASSGLSCQQESTKPNLEYDQLIDEDFIRLLTLEPNDQDGCLVGLLATTPLSNAPPYEVSSYIWGDPAVTKAMIC
jgi:hypothetical protein